MSKVKLQDIAKAAGVSMMTVSRVMNNDPKVGDKTREKVSEIAKKMQYKPNVAARHLASSKSYIIGLLCEYANASYVNQFLVGSLRACRTNGYHVMLDETSRSVDKTLNVVKDLIEITNVDGLVLLPPISDMQEVIDYIVSTKTKFVRIAPNVSLSASPFICMDDYQAAFDITSHLISTGHTRIAHIMGNPNQGVSHKRYQGYLDALYSHSLSVPPEYIVHGDFSYKSGLEAATKLLELPNKPDAIFAANDEMAAAVISVAHMKGVNVPQKMSIVGFDDTELATTIWPHLTTVRQPLEKMAELAIDIIISQRGTSQASPSIQPHADKNTAGSSINRPLQRHVLDYQIMTRASSNNIVS